MQTDEQEDEPDDDEDAEGPTSADAKRRAIIEQLGAAARFPAATEATAQRVLHFLALHAFLQVAPGGGASVGKKGKKKKGAGGTEGEEGELLLAAGRCSPVPSRQVRELCAARLVGLLAALRLPQQEPQAGASGRGAAEAGEGDQRPAKRARKQAAPADAPPPQLLAAQRRDAAAALQERLLSDVLGFIGRVQASPGVSLELEVPDEAQTALEVLREVEAALAATAAATATTAAGAAAEAKGGSSGDVPGGQLARVRALLQVVRLLQLQLLADPLGFDAAVAMDVRRVAVRGMGVQLEEQEASEEEEDEEADEVWTGWWVCFPVRAAVVVAIVLHIHVHGNACQVEPRCG